MVAQQIIHNEKLSDNIMLYGYQGDNIQYLDIYDIIIIEEFWRNKERMDNIDDWASLSRKNLLKSFIRCWSGYKKIDRVISSNNISTLFLGDMNNFSCKFSSFVYINKMKICFFEEGVGHYVFSPKRKSILPVDLLLGVFADVFFYLPFFRFCFGSYAFWKNLYFEQLPIDIRYNIRPFYFEKFDKRIVINNLMSRKLKELLNNEVLNINGDNKILFLNSPIYSMVSSRKKAETTFYKLLEDYFSNEQPNTSVCIKFHPSDKTNEKDKIIDIIKRSGLSYCVIAKNKNIPVEFYLQAVSFKYVVGFYSATFNYNGYMYPKTNFYSLVHEYYLRCYKCGLKSLGNIENMIKAEDVLIEDCPEIKRFSFGS